ncbi:MAG: Grx4 family monothiol glutaredoxin [Alphaproteobacteria bacterium]|nr:Grx4 family monothiol glutaredoxin [Alphaproteobacteria bacterium]
MSNAEHVTKELSENNVVLYMKGTADYPACGFSGTVCQILKRVGVSFKSVNILEDKELRDSVRAITSWPTFPQLFVKGEFVGGCDIVREIYSSGELQQILKDKGVPFQENAA